MNQDKSGIDITRFFEETPGSYQTNPSEMGYKKNIFYFD
jgi:hypothetical protein